MRAESDSGYSPASAGSVYPMDSMCNRDCWTSRSSSVGSGHGSGAANTHWRIGSCRATAAGRSTASSTGTSRTVSTVNPRSVMVRSISAVARAAPAESAGRKKFPTQNCPSVRSRRPVTLRKKRSDRSIDTPPPSPTPAEDMPPRWGTEHRASAAFSMTSCRCTPSLRVMKPTPQLLFSSLGSHSSGWGRDSGRIRPLFSAVEVIGGDIAATMKRRRREY